MVCFCSSLHSASLSERVSHLDAVEKGRRDDYSKAVEQGRSDSDHVTGTLEQLAASVAELCALYRQTTMAMPHSPDSHQVAVFLTQLPLAGFQKGEEKFTTALTAFTKKQFFQVISICMLSSALECSTTMSERQLCLVV